MVTVRIGASLPDVLVTAIGGEKKVRDILKDIPIDFIKRQKKSTIKKVKGGKTGKQYSINAQAAEVIREDFPRTATGILIMWLFQNLNKGDN